MRYNPVIFCLILLLGIWASRVQAAPRIISLHLLGQSPMKVYQNDSIKIDNTFQANLYNLTVTKPPLPKEIISVPEFLSGQSFDLSFSKLGAYEICFSREVNQARTCLTLDVLKRTVA
jgi:hypothetical protein